MYRATVHVQGNPAIIEKCFAPEDKRMGDRSRYMVKREKNGVVFEVRATDSVALRAHLNSITKMLTVIEKMENI